MYLLNTFFYIKSFLPSNNWGFRNYLDTLIPLNGYIFRSSFVALSKRENQDISWEYSAYGTLIKALLKIVFTGKIWNTNIAWDIPILKKKKFINFPVFLFAKSDHLPEMLDQVRVHLQKVELIRDQSSLREASLCTEAVREAREIHRPAQTWMVALPVTTCGSLSQELSFLSCFSSV